MKADESVFSILEIGRDEGDNNPGQERTCEANGKRYVRFCQLSADLRNRFHGDFFGGGGGVVYLKGLKAIVCIPGWMKKFSFPFRRESEGRLQYSRIEYCNVM